MIRRYMIPAMTALMFYCITCSAQIHRRSDNALGSISRASSADTLHFVPKAIPDRLPRDLFIPSDRLAGLTPWMGAPITRPSVHVIPVYGFSGWSFGQFTVDHWDKFFSNLLVFNGMDVPQVVDSQQMLLGNTISLGKKRRLFFANGILYGRQYGTWGNMIGMGSREGLIYRPSGYLIITVWTQEYQSVYAYSPVVYAYPGEGTAAIRLPASPLMVSYGAQAYFLAGQFWIGIGASFWYASDPVGH